MQLVPHDGFSFLRRCIPPRVRCIRRLGGFPVRVGMPIHLIAHLPTARRCQFARVGDLGPREGSAVFMLWRSVAFRSGCFVRVVTNLVLYFKQSRVGRAFRVLTPEDRNSCVLGLNINTTTELAH